ncbi:MAG: CHAT domain-containing tetratricopeptide repeat protein [Bryobacteraceae bacterium]
MKTLSLATALVSAVLSLHAAECPALPSARSIEVTASKNRSPCFRVVVDYNHAAQLYLESPSDLAIHVHTGNTTRVIDAFEFGRETATLPGPATYSVTVRAVSPGFVHAHVGMSPNPPSLQAASEWIHTEDLTTGSKAQPTPENTTQSLHAWQSLGDPSSIARAQIARGVLNYGAGKYRDAIEDFHHARTLCAPLGDARCVAEAATNEGMACNRIGEYGNALQFTRDAVEEWQRSGNQLNLGMTLSNLGLIYWRIGDLQSGIAASDKAVTLLRNRDEVASARALNNLGLCYQVTAEYDWSATYFRRALEIFERHRSGAAVRARLNLGRTLYLSGDLHNAQVLLEEALLRCGKDRLAQAEAQNNLGQVLLKLHRLDQAAAQFQAASATFQEIGDRRNSSAAGHYLGLVARARGDLSEAATRFHSSLETRVALGLREDAAESLAALADLDYAAGHLDAAKEHAERALKLLESVRLDVPGPALKASFYTRKRSLFDLLIDMEAASSRPDSAAASLIAAERSRARALMDQLAVGELLKQIPPVLESRDKQLQRRIDLQTAELSRAPEDRQPILRAQLQLLIAEAEAVQAQIREIAWGHNLAQPLTSTDQLQRRALPPDSALIEYHIGDHNSYLWLVERAQIRMWSLPGRGVIEDSARDASTRFGQIRERFTKPAARLAFQQSLQRLSALLLAPLAGLELPTRLILAPDVSLLPVPFAALRIPGERQALGLQHDLIQVPSAAYLEAGNQVRPLSAFPKTLLAFADPVFSADDPRVTLPPSPDPPAIRTLSRLPFTAELDAAAALVPPARRQILRGFQASRASLQSLPLASYAIIHLSTHALIDDRIPELSRLALSLVDPSGHRVDGYVRPYQLARLRLPGSTVVLSACDTALGKQVAGEGMAGLANSLFYAGASQLVLTLTHVDAEGSAQFLAETYRNLFGPGQLSFDQALTRARRKLAASVRWSDPYYWASFVVIGKPLVTKTRASAGRPLVAIYPRL